MNTEVSLVFCFPKDQNDEVWWKNGIFGYTCTYVFFPAKAEDCCCTHLIDGDGTFDATELDKFMKEVKLSECGLSYAVVSIMGPQSSGMYKYSTSNEFFLNQSGTG